MASDWLAAVLPANQKPSLNRDFNMGLSQRAWSQADHKEYKGVVSVFIQ